MESITVVYWENEPQFAVINSDGSRETAVTLEDTLNSLLSQVKEQHGDEWNCSDLQEAAKQAGLKTSGRIPINDAYWRYDAV